jgi:hypothetical protein
MNRQLVPDYSINLIPLTFCLSLSLCFRKRANRGELFFRRRLHRLPSASGHRLGAGGGWKTRSCRLAFFSVSSSCLLGLLGLGLGCSSPVVMSQAEMEAGVRWRGAPWRTWRRWAHVCLPGWRRLRLFPSSAVSSVISGGGSVFLYCSFCSVR